MAKRRLKTMDDLRRFVADLINRMESGLVEPALAGRLGYLANILKGIIERGDLESRIEDLENLMRGR